jgi:nicotinamidase/pyrazinamidase
MIVHFDIDTQLDFMVPAGALYVPGAEAILPAVVRLNQGAPLVVSTMDAHAEADAEFQVWPAHCVKGTLGQRKPAATLREPAVTVGTGLGLPDLSGVRQILLEKQQLDLFTNPNLPALLERLQASAYLVYGVVTEYCVRFAALGLLATGKPVTLVTDAIQGLDERAAQEALDEFTACGGALATVSEVCGQ